MTNSQDRESVVTFVHRMGNKQTSEMYLTHVRVNRKKVTLALEWLKIHHSGYHDITINIDNLTWMNRGDRSTLVAGIQHIEMEDKKSNDNRQCCSKVQCARDSKTDA